MFLGVHGYLFVCLVSGTLVIVVVCYKAIQRVTVTKGLNCA